MDEFNFEVVAVKSIKGVFALFTRTLFIQILSLVASFILTVYLTPANYGVFFIVSSIIVFLTYFQDIGLAAALIQKKEEITVEELRTTFTLQQILVGGLILIAFILSRPIISIYHLDTGGYVLFLSLLFSFFISSLRTIPTIMMERKLDYKKLVIPEIAESLTYNIILIVMAVSGFGLMTFTVAVLARCIVGLIATYAVQPWPIGISFHFKSIKRLFSFGIPYQANTFLALFKDNLITIYIGGILPVAQVGYIGFAEKWAYMPLRLVMDNVIRIAFPSMSRLQHDKAALRTAIEKSLFLVSFFIFPIVVCIINFSPFLITFIPRYEKWQPALIALSFYALNTVFSSISTPLTNFLTAIGKVKITFYFMILWTAGIWILTPFFIFKFGYNGVAAASFLVSTTSIFVFIIARRYIDFSFTKPVARQFLAAVIMFGFIFLTKGIITNFAYLILDALMAVVVYIGFLFLIAREELVKTFRFIIISIRSKS